MEITRSVEPCLIVETRHIDNQRVAFPMARRPAHPCVIGTFQLAIHVDGSIGAREFVGDQDVQRRLNDLKWIWHVRRARHTRQIALDLWIGSQPLLRVLFLLCRRLRQVGDFVAFHDASARRNAERGTERGDRSHLGRMILDIPIRGVERFPNAVQVRLPIRRARRLVSLGIGITDRRHRA